MSTLSTTLSHASWEELHKIEIKPQRVIISQEIVGGRHWALEEEQIVNRSVPRLPAQSSSRGLSTPL